MCAWEALFPSDSRERASTHQNVGTSNGQAREVGGGGGGDSANFNSTEAFRSDLPKIRYPVPVP